MNDLLVLAQAAAADAPRVGMGRIVGGWGYIWLAYGLTWSGLFLYGLSLYLRRRSAAREP